MMTREEELSRDGWEKKFVSCEPRLSEMAELYESLGLEVLLEPLPPKDSSTKGVAGRGGARSVLMRIPKNTESYSPDPATG